MVFQQMPIKVAHAQYDFPVQSSIDLLHSFHLVHATCMTTSFWTTALCNSSLDIYVLSEVIYLMLSQMKLDENSQLKLFFFFF